MNEDDPDATPIFEHEASLFGGWEHFPVSPQSAYDALTAQFDLNRRPCGDGWATHEMVYDIAAAEQRLIDRAKGDLLESWRHSAPP